MGSGASRIPPAPPEKVCGASAIPLAPPSKDPGTAATPLRLAGSADPATPGAPAEPTHLTSDQLAEVLEVLRGARVRRPNRWLRQLAEAVREIEEFPAGAELDGAGAWAGERLVLSGTASVLLGASPLDLREVEVARLRSGDSFGWPASAPAGDLLHREAWSENQPRVLVVGGGPLRLCRLPEEAGVADARAGERQASDGGAPRRPGRALSRKPSGRHAAVDLGQPAVYPAAAEYTLRSELGEHHPLSDCLAGLWLTASAPRAGIASLALGMPRAHFLAALWAPLTSRLEEHLDEIRRRKSQGYRIHDCFPLQGHEIADLARHIMQITEVWYGSERGGNLSSMYSWFIGAMETLGVTAYAYGQIPREVTRDGWATAVDGAARASALKGKGSNDALYVATGGMAQRQGRSAIDNTVLRNKFRPDEVTHMFVGRQARKFICKLISLRQRVICRRLSEYLQLDLEWMSQPSHHRGHTIVRSVLQTLPCDELRAAGVSLNSPCYQGLREKGTVISGFGQLEAARQRLVQEVARGLVDEHLSRMAADGGHGKAESESVFDRFVAWCRDYPGEFFQHDKHLHITTLIAGMVSRSVVVVKRSVVEKFTLARYIPLSWSRSQPLWGTSASGPFQVRVAGSQESSSVRANECPYADLHGMSMSAGAFASARCRHPADVRFGVFSLMSEMQWVRDPASNIENWFITDIEKIVEEAWQLNPRGPAEHRLPGECFVMVGQNPKVGSSIKQTQHTQLCQGSLGSYPLLQVPSRAGPRAFEQLNGASAEVVSVGPAGADQNACGLFVRVRTAQPTCPKVLKFLVDLRLHVMSSVDKASDVDFLMLALRDEREAFVLILAPLPQLEKVTDEPPDLAVWANPLTGESSLSAGLEESRIDFGKGVGHFLVAKQALRDQLLAGGRDTVERIWAFNRVPGLRDMLDRFFLEHGFPELACNSIDH